MSSKKITELTQAAGITDTDLILIETIDGTHSIPYSKVKEPLVNEITAVREEFENHYVRREYTYSKTEVDTLILNLTDDFQQKIDVLSDKITDMDISIPDAITDFTSDSLSEDTYISFSFTIPTNTKCVKLYSSTNQNVSSNSFEKCSVLELSEDDTVGSKRNWKLGESDGYIIGKKYYFVAYAYNNKGHSEASNIISDTFRVPKLYIFENGFCPAVTGGVTCNFDENNHCITFYKEPNSYGENGIIRTEKTLKEMFGTYDYSDCRMYIKYSLNTDYEENDYFVFGVKLINYLRKYISDENINISASHSDAYKEFISNHLNDEFSLEFIFEGSSFRPGCYLDLKIREIYFGY